MSWYGRRVVAFDFEKRWSEGHAAGKVHRFEASRILAGDLSPIVRELKPGFEQGAKHVLSRNRPRGALVLDRSRNVEILYPRPPAVDLFWIVVRDIVRHRSGTWRVRFDVFDRRETDYYVRRKPPVYTIGQEEEEAPVEAQVRIDSAYTTDPSRALDPLPSVPPEYHNVLQMQARDRWAEHKHEERAEDKARADAKRISATIRDTMLTLARNGGDLDAYVAEVSRAAQSSQLDRAA